jgi:cutinase
MKTFFAAVLLPVLVAAGPIEQRQVRGRVGTTAKEFSQGGCQDNIFIFSRGSTEVGNMVCG